MSRFMSRIVHGRFGRVARCVLVFAAMAAASQAGISEAAGYRYRGYRGGRSYGSNFGYTYTTPRFRYYNGPAFGYGYGGYGRGNVQYFQRGRNAFWVGTGYDSRGRIQTNTGFFYFR